jgi:hypothetical protein
MSKKNPKLKKNGGEGTRVGNLLRDMVSVGKKVAPEILEAASKLTGIEALDNLGRMIEGDTELTDMDKALLMAQLEYDRVEMQEITKRWSSDMMSDSWMSKNIRPYTLAFLTIAAVFLMTADSFQEQFQVDSLWIEKIFGLLQTVYIAYFGGRTAEKGAKMYKAWKQG